jgi:tRNA U34 5-methylaminomethyl-2-thiouridine-forming methyltransferase MnmC
MSISYAEQARTDPALAAFIAAEVARAGVELAALKVEHVHQREVIADLKRRIKELEAEHKGKPVALKTRRNIK